MARRSSSVKPKSRKQAEIKSTSADSSRQSRTSSRRRGSRQRAHAFATRLTSVMQERGLTNVETAKRMREHLPEGEGFSPANISHYRSGRSVPRSSHLEALSQALGIKPSDLVTEELPDEMKAAAESRPAQGRRSGRQQKTKREQPGRRRHITRVSDTSGIESAEAVPVLQIEDLGTEVRIRFDQSFPWDAGMKLIQALKASGTT